MAKSKYQQVTTPKGVALYPWLNKPDSKFKAEGEYKMTLRLPASEKRDALVATLEAALEAGYKAQVAELAKDPKNKGKKVKRSEDLQWKPVVDDNGDETGEIDFKFKMKASGTKKDGSPWTMAPKLFDAANAPFDRSRAIYGGSTVSVAFEIFPWYTPKFGFGIQLRLNAVKIYTLVEGSGGNAEQYGFDDADEDEIGNGRSDAEAGDTDGTDDATEF
jgi:hypothetical protein